MVDEIVEPADPPAIILKYLDDDLLAASNATKLNRKEIKYVSKGILESLKTLHEEGYVHTGKQYMQPLYTVSGFSHKRYLQTSNWIISW